MSGPRALVFWHDDVGLHDPGSLIDDPVLPYPEPHPESLDRLENIRAVLRDGPLAELLEWRTGRPATIAELERFHDRALIERVKSFERLPEPTRVDRYLAVSSGTWRAAVAAAGASIASAEAVMAGECSLAYALIRPPGHHSSASTAEGYCIFNNVGLTALEALRCGAERVAIVDWDAHHGNGAQSFFYGRPDVLTISLHLHTGPLRVDPSGGEGRPEEIGTGSGRGGNINVQLPWGTGDAGYLMALDEIVLPALRAYGPTVLVGAMAQDAGMSDPNGRQSVTMAGFHALGARLGAAAREFADGRVVLVQEGGYSRSYAPLCAYATLAGFLEEPLKLDDPINYLPADDGESRGSAIERSCGALRACQELASDIGRT